MAKASNSCSAAYRPETDLSDAEETALSALGKEELEVFSRLHARCAEGGPDSQQLMAIIHSIAYMGFDELDELVALYNKHFFPAQTVVSSSADDWSVVFHTDSPRNAADGGVAASSGLEWENVLLQCGHLPTDLRETCAACCHYLSVVDQNLAEKASATEEESAAISVVTAGGGEFCRVSQPGLMAGIELKHHIYQADGTPIRQQSLLTSAGVFVDDEDLLGISKGGVEVITLVRLSADSGSRDADKEPVYCDICKIHLNGRTQYEDHLLGKKHKKKLLTAGAWQRWQSSLQLQ